MMLAFAVPALFSAMFDSGHTWTYDLTVNGKKTTMTCKVAEVKVFGTTVASKITCDSDDAFTPAGLWIASPTSLGQLTDPELPDSAKGLAPIEMIPLKPHKSSKRVKDDEGGYTVERVFAKKGMWCAQDDGTHVSNGDLSISTFCFKPGVGLAWGELDMKEVVEGETPRHVVFSAR
jgi:hypothetical protein